MASASNSPPSAASSIRVALHADLKELLAKPQADRQQFLEELYMRAIPEYLSSILSSDEHDAETMKCLERMIASLNTHRLDTEYSLAKNQLELFASQISQQCAPIAIHRRNMHGLCSALSAGRSDYAVEWSLALPLLHAEHLQKQESLFRALFERSEWLNASRHLFVVPLLVGGESDLSRVDANVREFCIQLKSGELEMGCVARELLQVHAERSAQLAAQCVQRAFEWGAVWESFEWAVQYAAEYSSEDTAAELIRIVLDISQLIHSEKWRSEQRDLLIALSRCKNLWLYPIGYDMDKDEQIRRTDKEKDYNQPFAAYYRTIHKCLLFYKCNMDYRLMRLIHQIEEKSGTLHTSLLVRTLIDMFEYCAELLDVLECELKNESQQVTDSRRSLVEALEQTPVRTHSKHTIEVYATRHGNAATELFHFCTRAHRWQRDAERDSALDASVRERLLRLPFARSAAKALRICVQCCTVQSLLEKCVDLAKEGIPEDTDALVVAVVDEIGAMVQSDEWRAEMKRNLLTALSVQEIWFFSIYLLEVSSSTLSRHCFLFMRHNKLFYGITSCMKDVNSRLSRAVFSCVRHLLEFAVQMLDESGLRIADGCSNAAINEKYFTSLKI